MLSFLGVFLGALVIRLVPLYQCKAVFDTYCHIYFADEVRSQEVGPSGSISTRVLGSDGFQQPFLWHWLIGVFPTEWLLRHQRWINGTLDALFAVLLYGISLGIGLSERAALWVSLIYLFTPMWFSRFSKGPRVNSLTPRLFGELAGNAFFCITMLRLGIPDWVSLIAGALLSAAVILSSKFGLQALVFLVPLVTAVATSLFPLGALAGGFMVALLISRGQIVGSIKRQVHHLIWYFRKNFRGAMPISDRNSLKKLLERPPDADNPIRYVFSVVKRLLVENSYSSTIIKMPVLFVGIGGCLWLALAGQELPPTYLIAPVAAGSVVFLLINRPLLLFLGEAERYLNYVAVFICVLVVVISEDLALPAIPRALVIYGLCFWLLEILVSRTVVARRDRTVEAADNAVVQFLKTLREPTLVLLYPFGAAGGVFRILLETPHQVLYNFTTTEEFSERFEREYAVDFPYVDLGQLDAMTEEYGVGVFVAYEKVLSERQDPTWEPGDRWTPVDLGQSRYRVYYRRKGLTAADAGRTKA